MLQLPGRVSSRAMIEGLEARRLLAGTGLIGTYFDNPDFTGATQVRTDSTVDFNWGDGAPIAGIGPDTFSVRWQGEIKATGAGNYQIRTITDDGVRLWVDGAQVIDDWNCHSPTASTSASIALTAGQLVSIRMEYFESGYGAVARLQWLQPGQSTFTTIPQSQLYPTGLGNGLRGDYFANETLAGVPYSRTDPVVGFNWGSGSPSGSISADHFSARWTGEIEIPESGSYQFQTQSDDGVRLWIDGNQVISNWTLHSSTADTSGAITLAEGQRVTVTMEYFESGGGAIAKLLWKRPGQSGFELIPNRRLYSAPVAIVGGLSAQYYYNSDYTSPAESGVTADINIAADGSGDALRSGPLSVIYKGKVIAPITGTVRLYLYTKGGGKLWLDGRIIIDSEWDQTWGYERYADVQVEAGKVYPFRANYFATIVDAQCTVCWSYDGQAKQVIPNTAFSPDTFETQLAYSQTGWHPSQPKPVVLNATDFITAPTYQVLDALGQQVLSGTMSYAGQYWSRYQYTADLSSLTTAGTYTLNVGRYAHATITIVPDVFTNIRIASGTIGLTDILNSFWYYQRDPNPYRQNNPPVYVNVPHYRELGGGQPRQLIDSEVSADLTGGWYDATSHDKAVIEHGNAVANLCYTLEHTSDQVTRQALMAEIRYGLDFLFKIQNPDGSFPLMLAPDIFGLIVNQSAGVAGRSAAAFAAAYQVFRYADPALASRCLVAAEKAWAWIEANPSSFNRGVSDESESGSTGSVIGGAVELARATGKQIYLDYVANSLAIGEFGNSGYWMGKNGTILPGQITSTYWGQLQEVFSGFTAIALARYYSIAPTAALKQQVRDDLLQYIQCIRKSTSNPYSVQEAQFQSWQGFSQNMSGQAACLLHIGLELNMPEAVELALRFYEWDTGSNPLGTSQIVGFGTREIIDPFARPAEWTVGGILPGVMYKGGEMTVDYGITWSQWSTGEGGLSASTLPAILAMLNAYYSPRAAPSSVTTVVNDGAAQRSMVTSLTVAFDQPVTLMSDAVTLSLRGSTLACTISISNPLADGKTYVLKFSGTGIIGSSLPDGMYDLTIKAASVQDAYGQTLSGGNRTYSFLRLYGDYDGNGITNNADYFWFKKTLNQSVGSSAYLWFMDYDGNGVVNNSDYFWFKKNLNKEISL